MKRPIIGITPSLNDEHDSYKLNICYAEMVKRAGGCALILPYDFDRAELLDGVIFSGGGDMCASLAGYEDGELVKDALPQRDELEVRLFKTASAMKLPILGICRGCQLLNVMAGGTLHRDIAEAGYDEEHWLAEKGYHPVLCEKGSMAERMFEKTNGVWSTHHQAIDRSGDGYAVTARSPKGVVEAIEHNSGRILGLQTHPERMELTEPFKWLIMVAGQR
ncbi:MAG: gamma-glutamyl-gamma-aminobutyrate hydrolase family protein [Clostridia bacterium]